MPDGWSIIAHGGAKEIKPEEAGPARKGLDAALRQGAAVLATGGTALEAVVKTICVLENNPMFNAGHGSARRVNGEVEMDASLMCGRTLNIGAVANIKDVQNPILVAAQVLADEPILLVGGAATEYARQKGFGFFKQSAIECGGDEAHDTVGCVARDSAGNFAVGVSTGGLEKAVCGRVGDTALPGCGFYADNTVGAACMSGEGENIARVMVTAHVMQKLRETEGEAAILSAMENIARVDGEMGCILLDGRSIPAWNHNSSHSAVAYQLSVDPEPKVFLQKQEEAAA